MDGTITNSDPNIYSADNLNISASDNPKIAICLQNNSSGVWGAIYFTTTTDNTWTESKGHWFTISSNDSTSHVYTIDLSAIGTWTGTIKQFRFDPSEASSGSFNIDYIRLEKN